MIRTCCAACGKLLPHTAPRCGNCSTPYCDRDCQKLNWKTGGHKDICKKIKKAGGVQQYCADTRCAEAIALAVEECADDTKGQTCYICTEAFHWKTKEGLVRMCACRGTAGVAHVSCLADQAKILLAQVEENNLGMKAINVGWRRWETCGLCKQDYHGIVRCALGWACYRTYLGRPETDWAGRSAIRQLANGLCAAGQNEDALRVREAELSMARRLGAPEDEILRTQGNLAITYEALGRPDEAILMKRDVYFGRLKLRGEEHEETLGAANNYAGSLINLQRIEEAKTLLRKKIPVARRVLGNSHEVTFHMRTNYARALYFDPDATLDYFRESVATLEELKRTAQRVFGGAHPLTAWIEGELQNARTMLAIPEGALAESLRKAVVAMTPGTP